MPSPIGFEIKDIEPGLDPAYALSRAAQQAFWNQVGIIGLRVKRLSLARGLDKNGNPLAPISNLTRIARRDDINSVTAKHPYSPRGRARVTAPPLQATGTASRTYSLLRFDVRGESVWFSWGFDAASGMDWGIVLARHANGFTQRFAYPQPGWGHVPSRDVIGLSAADITQVTHEVRLWWGANRRQWAPHGEGSYLIPPRKPVRKPPPQAKRAKPVRYNQKTYLSGPGLAIVTGHTGEAKRLPYNQLFQFRGPQKWGTPPPIIPPSAPSTPMAPTTPMTPAAVAKFFVPKQARVPVIASSIAKWVAIALGLAFAGAAASYALGNHETPEE